MPEQTLTQLNDSFALTHQGNSLTFKEGMGGIPVVEIFNRHASALISLQGAHLLSWKLRNESIDNEDAATREDCIWLSQDAVFAKGKSVRGGIPICWPWFGQHPQNLPGAPAHGFARTRLWQVTATESLENGDTQISFTLPCSNEDLAQWPGGAPENIQVNYVITIGKKLELELVTENRGSTPVQLSEALHTYFRVGDIGKVLLHGLDDTEYLDKPDNFKRKLQHGPVTIEGEIDRVYLDTVTDCVIEDRELGRNIIIIKFGSKTTVVWNPGEQVAEKMGDLGPQGYRHMLCAESGNAADNTITIQPGKSHRLWVQYEAQAI